MLISDNDLLSQTDLELVHRILIGCTKDVYQQERRWYNTDFRFGKPSTKLLVGLQIYNHLRSDPNDILRTNDIKSRFSKELERVDPSTVSRAFKTLVNTEFLKLSQEQLTKPRSHIRDEPPGPKSSYAFNDYQLVLQQLVSRQLPREIIFKNLLQSGIITQYLKIYKYKWMILRRDTDVNVMIKALKTKGPIEEKSIDIFKSEYIKYQNALRKKNNKQVKLIATNGAKKEVKLRDGMSDPIYTEFFINGGVCYFVDYFTEV